MNTNTRMSETRELTDDELNTVSGGIIFVGGRPPILREDALNPQPLPPSPPPGEFLRFYR